MAVILGVSSLILSLYECPGQPELRCLNGRFNSSRLSEDEVALVRPLVVSTKSDTTVVNCSSTRTSTRFPAMLPDPAIRFDNSPFIRIPRAILNNRICFGDLPFIGFGLFSRTWADFVLAPNQVIINPQHNATVCRSGGLPENYVHIATDRFWTVSSEIRIAENTYNFTELHEVIIDASNSYTLLTDAQYVELIQALAELGLQVIDTPYGNAGRFHTFVPGCNGDEREILPIITFIIYDGLNNTPVTELQIGPDDYLTADCRLTVRGSLYGSPSVFLGNNVLKNLAIHFRAESQTIGICDPLD